VFATVEDQVRHGVIAHDRVSVECVEEGPKALEYRASRASSVGETFAGATASRPPREPGILMRHGRIWGDQ
jgi:hypothetical protein